MHVTTYDLVKLDYSAGKPVRTETVLEGVSLSIAASQHDRLNKEIAKLQKELGDLWKPSFGYGVTLHVFKEEIAVSPEA